MQSLLEIPFPYIVLGTFLCPAIAGAACLILSLTIHSHPTLWVRAACSEENYLPSFSYIITELTPERYVWRWFIALHTVPRLAVAVMYWTYYLARLPPKSSAIYRLLCPTITVLHWIENFAILGVSYVTLKESAWFHDLAYVTFLVVSTLYMTASCSLTRTALTRNPNYHPNEREKRSAKYKHVCLVANLVCLFSSLYFYHRDSVRCEPYVYSLFSLSEYGIIMSNMIFHFTAYWDFADQSFYAVPAEEYKYN